MVGLKTCVGIFMTDVTVHVGKVIFTPLYFRSYLCLEMDEHREGLLGVPWDTEKVSFSRAALMASCLMTAVN